MADQPSNRGSHWLIELRCGECGCWHEAPASNEEAAAFDVAPDRQIAPMARHDRERMEVEVETFVTAQQHDLVDAADFAH